MLGPIIIPPLEEFIASSLKSETRTLASILLLHLGSKNGLEDVLEELKVNGPNAIIAAHKLARANISETGEIVIDRLRSIPENDVYDRAKAPFVNSYLAVLEKLGTPLPEDLKERFTRPDVPRDISAFIK